MKGKKKMKGKGKGKGKKGKKGKGKAKGGGGVGGGGGGAAAAAAVLGEEGWAERVHLLHGLSVDTRITEAAKEKGPYQAILHE